MMLENFKNGNRDSFLICVYLNPHMQRKLRFYSLEFLRYSSSLFMNNYQEMLNELRNFRKSLRDITQHSKSLCDLRSVNSDPEPTLQF